MSSTSAVPPRHEPIAEPSSPASSTAEQKVDVYIRIVRLLLEEEDSVTADTFFKRASLLIHHIKDPVVILQYKLVQARMLDFSCRFAEAASKYHEVSYITIIDESERLRSL